MKLFGINLKASGCRASGKTIFQVIALLVLLSANQAVVAIEDVAGSREAEFLARYPNSVISHFSERETDDYTLYISSLKKVNGVWRAEKQRSLEGDLLRLTYLIPGGHNLALVSEFYQKQIDALIAENGEQLFYCEKRGCGSSNQWANMVFGIKQLYGSDRDQFYRVDRFERGGQEYYLVFYLIKRGNQRIYAHIDLFAIQQKSGSDALASLQQGSKVVVALKGDREKLLRQVVSFLEKHPERKLYVVGHRYGEQSVEILQAQAKQAAEDLVEQLAAKTNVSGRVEVYGLGPLAPQTAITSGSDRIELIPY